MANGWIEACPNLTDNEFEIYDNRSPGFSMDHFHGHSFYEMRIILRGAVTHYSENNVATVGAGDVSILPPGLFHRTTLVESGQAGEEYIRILLYASSSFVHALDTEALHFAEIFDHFGYHGKQHLHFSPEELSLLTQPLQEIVRAGDDHQPLRHLYNRTQVILVLARIAEKIAHAEASDASGPEASLVPRVIAYINANLSKNLSLDNLSERFFVSKFYLSHQFKQYTQLSLHQYILSRRMMHAQVLLRSGLSPTAVAAACGYHEYSSFYKAFLRETGQSPRTFV